MAPVKGPCGNGFSRRSRDDARGYGEFYGRLGRFDFHLPRRRRIHTYIGQIEINAHAFLVINAASAIVSNHSIKPKVNAGQKLRE